MSLPRVPSDAELARLLNEQAGRVGDRKVQPIAEAFDRGYVGSVYEAGRKASVRERTSDAAPTAGFDVPPYLQVAAGDQVWYYARGSDRLVIAVLDRNAVLPTLLELSGLLVKAQLWRATVSAALSADVTDYLPPGGGVDAFYWRVDSSAHLAVHSLAVPEGPDEHVWVNITTAYTHTLKHGSTTGNIVAGRLLLPGSADLALPPNASARLWYDVTSQRWRGR